MQITNIDKYFNNCENVYTKITLYNNLRLLNLKMCDFIPDEILFILKLIRN